MGEPLSSAIGGQLRVNIRRSGDVRVTAGLPQHADVATPFGSCTPIIGRCESGPER